MVSQSGWMDPAPARGKAASEQYRTSRQLSVCFASVPVSNSTAVRDQQEQLLLFLLQDRNKMPFSMFSNETT